MQNPLAGVLPAQMHFLNLQGGQIVFLLGLMIFFGSFGGRLFQKLHCRAQENETGCQGTLCADSSHLL